jgi:Domain of unknown function (DUF4160)
VVHDRVVPEISRFFGIVVFMNYQDHPPPHFHVRYAERRAIVAIESPAVLEGNLSLRALGLVMEWAAAHRRGTARGLEPCAAAAAAEAHRAAGVDTC